MKEDNQKMYEAHELDKIIYKNKQRNEEKKESAQLQKSDALAHTDCKHLESHSNDTTKVEKFKIEITREQAIEDIERQLHILFDDFDIEPYFVIIGDTTKGVWNDTSFKLDAKSFEKIARKYALTNNTYIAVHPHVVPNRRSESVSKCLFLYVDLDRKEEFKKNKIDKIDDLNVVLNELTTINLTPSLIVFTGFGYHVYFKLERMITKEEFERFENALFNYLKENLNLYYLEVDEHAKDVARALRLAGTYNTKENTKKYVQIVYTSDKVLSLEQLELIEKLVNSKEDRELEQKFKQIASTSKESFENALFDSIKEIYVEGQRDFLTMCIAGVFAKCGYSVDDAIEFYERYLKEKDDSKDYKSRIATIKHTFKKHEQGREIKAFSGLKELGANMSILNKVVKTEQVQKNEDDSEITFFIEDDRLYARMKDKITKVGAGIKIDALLVDEDEKKFKVKISFKGIERTDLKLTREEISDFVPIPIFSKRLFDEYIDRELRRVEKEKRLLIARRTGWFGNRFLLFNNELKDVYVEVNKDILTRFTTNEIDKQIELVRYCLEQANDLAIVYLVAFSSVLLKPLGLTGYTLLITGARGTGKTTIAKLATNLFYNANRKFTMDATETAFERLAYTFTDLPLFLDELALMKNFDELERIVFKLESGYTRARSNKSLEVKQQELRNVLITTNEFDVNFERQGAERRRLVLNLSERTHLQCNIQEAQNWIGAGKIFVDELIRYDVDEFVDNVKAKYESKCEHYYELALYSSFEFFKRFFNSEFEAMQVRLEEFLQQQRDELGDYFERSYLAFKEYIFRNKSKFYEIDRNSDKELYEQVEEQKKFKREVCGVILYDTVTEVLIFLNAFNEILNELKIDKKTFLNQLADNGLIYNKNKKEFRRRVKLESKAGDSIAKRFALHELNIETDYFYHIYITDITNEND